MLEYGILLVLVGVIVLIMLMGSGYID